jgi:hypothetical protein
MSSEDAKRALEACEKGVNEMIAISKANQEKVDSYHNSEVPEYNRRWEDWKNQKNNREKEKSDWDRRRDEKAHSKSGDRHHGPCEGWNHINHGCPSGWEDDGNGGHGCSKGFGKKACKKSWNLRLEEAAREIGSKPGDFTDQEPQRPSPPTQNQSNINIACCANITQVIASQVNDSMINQQNDCMSNLRKNYEENLLKEEEEKQKKESNKQVSSEQGSSEQDSKNNVGMMTKIGVSGFIVLCSCIFLLVIISIIIMFSGNNNQNDETSMSMSSFTPPQMYNQQQYYPQYSY